MSVNLGGRPAQFETEQELEEKISEYFAYLEGEYKDVEKRDEEDNPYTERVYTRYPEPATITGLALYLGFESRQSIYDYEKNGKFSYTIKRARLNVENSYEKQLLGKAATGAIFALKNFGWTDKQEIDNKSSDGSMSPKSTKIVFTNGAKTQQ